MNSSTPAVSFIGIVDFSEKARWVFLSESVSDLLGYEPRELVGTPSLDLVHPDEFSSVKRLHYDTITQDKAAVLVYLRMRHKDPYKGYILCAISRTVAYNVLVGSVSFASMGPKAMHNASTAQEVTVITPSAANFEFRRWGDPSPLHPTAYGESDSESGSEDDTETETESRESADRRRRRAESKRSEGEKRTTPSAHVGSSVPDHTSTQSDDSHSKSPSSKESSPQLHADPSRGSPGASYDPDADIIKFDPLPKQSVRTALFLDRFSLDCPIIYCSNDNFVQTTRVMGRPFFDFIAERDEKLVRSWIDAVKAWGVNERGQPSDGGFGYGKFTLYLPGRDSRDRPGEVSTQSRSRRGGAASGRDGSNARGSATARQHTSHSAAPDSTSRHRSRRHTRPGEEMGVDAIFSAHSDGLMVIIRHAKQ